ncbi:MAG: hypothetical protein Q7S89_02125 [bacterium]|nr:hypothetical protein [bacterium]
MRGRLLYLQGGEGSPGTSVAHSTVDDLEVQVIVGAHTSFDIVVSRPARDITFLAINGIAVRHFTGMGLAPTRVVTCSAEEYAQHAFAADAFLLCPPTDHPACIPFGRIVAEVLASDRPRRVALVGWDSPDLLRWVPEERRRWFASFSLNVPDFRPVVHDIREFFTRL